MNTDQRPKIEDFEEYSYIALKMLPFSGKNGEVISEQVSRVLGPNFVISFQEREVDIFHVIRERIRTNKGRIRKMGADYLAYCLLDAIVDNYFIIMEMLETFREVVAGMLEIYLSGISNRLNAVIKVLTMLATIFMPLTFIAGIYGMNFKHMPELEWRWGYPIVLLIMTGVSITMVYYFKKKKW